MSYRSSDAYSRRPTDDDRRGPDPRDRRRDSAGRGGFDPHRDDRQRRGADIPARPEPRNTAESPRDTLHTTNSAKPHVAVSSARLENGRTSSVSRSPADSPGLDRGTTCERLVWLCKKYADAVVEVARLRAERDPLEKVFKQRQAEYEKSMVRHAEFPSVPEVQNQHRVRYAERVRSLDAQIQKAQHEVDSTAESIAQAVFNLSSAQSRGSETRTVTPTIAPQNQETSKKHQAEINDLKTKIRKIEAERSQERTDLKAEFARQCADMKKEMEETVKEMRKELLKEAKTSRRKFKEETTEEMKEQLRIMRAELEKRQSAQGSSQLTDFQSKLSKHEQELTKAVEQKLLAHKNATKSVSTAEVFTLIQKEKSALQSDVTDLLQRVGELTEQLAQNTRDTKTLRDNLTSCDQRVKDEARRVEEHETKLSNLDTEALENVAETMSIDFPNLQQKVAKIQTKVDEVPQEIDKKQEALYARVDQTIGMMVTTAGTLVDGVQDSVTKHEARIKALEEASTSMRAINTAPGPERSTELGSISSEVASIKSDYDSTKVAVDRLKQEYTGLSEEVTKVKKDVSASGMNFNQQLDNVRLSLTVLDSQFNSLSTKTLAEHIIGNLEHFYPDAHQITADIGALKTMVDSIKSRTESLEHRVHDFKPKVDLDASKVSSMQEHLFKDIDESTRPSIGHKRKRTDPGLNGAEHLAMNGTN